MIEPFGVFMNPSSYVSLGLLLGLCACNVNNKSADKPAETSSSSALLSSSSLTDSLSFSSSQLSSSAPSSSSVVSQCPVDTGTWNSFNVAPKTNYVLPKAAVFTAIDTSQWLHAADVKISAYAHFYKTAFSLTFDDGFASQPKYIPQVLEKYGFRGTFFLVPPKLAESGQPVQWRYGSWDDFAAMAKNGHEMGSHTNTHLDFTKTTNANYEDEINGSAQLIRDHIPNPLGYSNGKLMTFAYPYVISDAKSRQMVSENYIAGRGGPYITQPVQLSEFYAFLMDFAYKPRTLASEVMEIKGRFETIDGAYIPKGQWYISLAHEVLPLDSIALISSYKPYSVPGLDTLCAELKKRKDQGLIWVAPMGQVAHYLHQVQRVKVGVLAESAQNMEIVVEDGLDDQEFPEKIAFELKVPTTWCGVKYSVGGNTVILPVKAGLVRLELPANGQKIKLEGL